MTASRHHSLGIDIGGTAVKVAVFAETCVETGGPIEIESPNRDGVRSAIERATASVRSPQATVGVCLPGVFHQPSRSLSASVNLPELVGVPIDSLLPVGMGLARVFTDAHAGAFDFFATHRTAGRILALSLGTGVGACVLDDGELLRVSPLAADGVGGGVSSGHLGQMDVSPACPEPVPVGRDGGRGSLEAYLGAPALRERFGNDLHAALRTVNLDDPAIRALVRGLRIAHAIYRPNTIALLGGVGLGLSHLIAPIRAATADGLTSLARPNWRLVAGDTLFHAAIGAARLAAQSLPLG